MSLEKLKETGLPFYFYCGGEPTSVPYVRTVPINYIKWYIDSAFMISGDYGFVGKLKDKRNCNFVYYLPHAVVLGVALPFTNGKRYKIFGSRNIDKTYSQNSVYKYYYSKDRYMWDGQKRCDFLNSVIEVSNVNRDNYKNWLNEVLKVVNR